MPGLFYNLAIHAPVGIYATNRKGQCTFVNPYLCKLLGVSRRRALGLGWMRSIHPLDRERVSAQRRLVIASAKPSEMRYRIVGRNGATTWVAASSMPVVDRKGRVRGRIGAVVDITAQKNAEALADRERRKASHAAERSPLALLALTAQGRGTPAALSPQEWRVLALVSAGKTNKEAARLMKLSDKTVKNYISNIFQKLHLRRRAEAAVYFAKLQGAAGPAATRSG